MAQERRTIKRKRKEKHPVNKAVETGAKKGISKRTKREIAFIGTILASILMILAIYTTDLTASREASDFNLIRGNSFIGPLGVIIKWIFAGIFGSVAYILPILCIFAGIYIIKTSTEEKSKLYIYISALFFAVCISALFYLFVYVPQESAFNIKEFWVSGTDGFGGGILGGILGYPLVLLANTAGATIILIAFMLVSFVVMTDFAITKFLASLVRKARESGRKKADEESVDKELSVSQPVEVKKEKAVKKDRFTEAAVDIVQEDSKPLNIAHEVSKLPYTGDKKDIDEAQIKIFGNNEKYNAKEEDEIEPLDKEPENTEEENVVIIKNKRAVGEIPVEIDRENKEIPYEFPDINLLKHPPKGAEDSSPAALRDLSLKLVETLKTFNIDVKVLEISKGPAITRFELQPTAGVRVSKITSLADDIALSLAATSIRIEAPIPGKAAIGIELPNSSISMVTIRDVLESKEFNDSKSYLSCALGRDIAGKCIVADIAKMPHVLIAGATGSGKSVCINSLVASLLYKASPNDVKLIMIDPKVVELSVYNGIPHLLIPVVTDPRKAAGALNWAVQEMTTRYRLFADNGVRNLTGYNELMEKKGMAKLPQIVIIIDELADLMMVASKDVEGYICRLAQLARAAGMHLVIATQRPSVNVITGVIKANIPSRIAFAVSSNTDSRTILDAGGAEKLLGKGDMLYYPMGASKPTRVQGAFISDDEVEALVEFVKKKSEAVYDEDVIKSIENSGSDGGSVEDNEDVSADPLLPKAIEAVVDAGQAAVSLVQRKLSVGYSRAGRLVDQMEARGIIGPHEGSKPRKVLITKEEYLAMLEGSGISESGNHKEEEILNENEIEENLYLGEDNYLLEDEDDEIIMPPNE